MSAATRWTQFITPLGGIIAIACFFLPWVTRVDNFGNARSGFQFTRSGFRFFESPLGPYAAFNAAVFIASVVIVCVSLYMIVRRTPWKSRVPVLMSSGIGLAILLADQLKYTRMNRILDHSNYAIELGFWGAAVGLGIAAFGILLLRTKKENGHAKDYIDVKQLWFVVHAGGIVAFFCFSMPWEGIGTLRGESGFQLMNREPLFTTALIANVIIILGSSYTLASGNLRRLRVVVLVSIGIGLGVLLCYCVDFYIREIWMQNILRKRDVERPGRFMSFGFWGTILGFISAAVGMFLIKRKCNYKQVEGTAE